MTDGVTTGTTTVTSATAPFTAAMVGNGINIVGDGFYQITAVGSSTSITVDRTTGTASGQTMKVGGATTISSSAGGFQPQVSGVLAAGHKMWVRATNAAGVATTYNPVFAGQPGLTTSGSQTNPITTEGYTTTRGDGGRFLLSMNGWAFNVSGNYNIFKNFSNTGLSGVVSAIHLTGQQCHLENMVLDPGSSTGPQFLSDGTPNNNIVRRIFTKAGGATAAFSVAGTGCVYEYCDIAGSTGAGVLINSASVFRNCIIRDNTTDGIQQNNSSTSGPSQFFNCIIWNNGRDGVRVVNSTLGIIGWTFENCIFGVNVGYDLNYTASDISTNTGVIEWAKSQLRCNFFFTTGTGRYHFLPAGADDTVLTVNPFNGSATGDFSLNSTMGGGLAISGAPCAVAFADGLNTSNQLSGFYGTVPSAAVTGLTSMRNLWRELTNERNTQVIPDSVVDTYLDFGLQELNRRIHFHYTTASDITLVEGVQEYTMPTAAIEIVWIQFGSNRLLEKGSVEQWRRLGEDWRNEPEGEPRFWAHYGNNFVLRPKPSALAVASAPNLTMRRKDTPPSITTNGPEQLPTEAYRIVVEYGAYLWSSCYPDSVVAQQRAAALKDAFEAGVQAMTESYARRELAL